MSIRIVVVGSSNTDMVVKINQLPKPGETITGGSFFMAGGGKGANQAVAAARLGGDVTFVGCIGTDVFGTTALAQLNDEGIHTAFVRKDAGAASGVALIMVDSLGENEIAVASGANALLSEADIDNAKGALDGADVILVQLEIPLQTVEYLARLAAEKNKKLILNPAPAMALPASLLESLFCITPNETEAEALTGISVHDLSSATAAASFLATRGPAFVVVTMGKQGALLFERGTAKATHIPAPVVQVLDTTAAGDVFNAGLAVALAEGRDPADAVFFASHAAALSVTRLGAQPSAPHRTEVDDFAGRAEIK